MKHFITSLLGLSTILLAVACAMHSYFIHTLETKIYKLECALQPQVNPSSKDIFPDPEKKMKDQANALQCSQKKYAIVMRKISDLEIAHKRLQKLYDDIMETMKVYDHFYSQNKYVHTIKRLCEAANSFDKALAEHRRVLKILANNDRVFLDARNNWIPTFKVIRKKGIEVDVIPKYRTITLPDELIEDEPDVEDID